MVSSSRVLRPARDLARLVLPVECPGCGRPDEILCPSCATVLAGPVRRCEDDVPRLDRMDGLPPLPVWTVTTYAGPVRGVVVAWKDRGRRDLTDHLVAAVAAAGEVVAGVLRASGLPGVPSPPGAAGVLQVVQVPTTTAARRRRGADLVGRLADGVAAGLTRGGLPALATPVLRRRAAADQVGLGARARGRNSARVTLHPGCDPRTRLHLLVDDVVTTGATLAACCRALEAAGGLVLGAVVVAATPPPAAHRPEPSYDALHGMVKGEWRPSPTSARTDAAGRVRVAGWFGEDEVDAPDGVGRFMLEPGAGEVHVRLGG